MDCKKTMAFVYSLRDKTTDTNHTAEVTILERKDDNNVIAEYNGIKCRAIFNWFTCMYYVDDVHGRIDHEGEREEVG